MKKIVAFASVFVLALALCACQPAKLAIDTTDDGVHVVAENGASGAGTGSISNNESEGIVINHIVDRGSFHVKIVGGSDKVYFDEDITDNIANYVDACGDFDVVIEAKNAVGSIDIIAYDKESKAMQDETLDEALARETGKSAEELGLSESSSAK